MFHRNTFFTRHANSTAIQAVHILYFSSNKTRKKNSSSTIVSTRLHRAVFRENKETYPFPGRWGARTNELRWLSSAWRRVSRFLLHPVSSSLKVGLALPYRCLTMDATVVSSTAVASGRSDGRENEAAYRCVVVNVKNTCFLFRWLGLMSLGMCPVS